jgi:hypothetical protein
MNDNSLPEKGWQRQTGREGLSVHEHEIERGFFMKKSPAWKSMNELIR